jgi:hypothetical protein
LCGGYFQDCREGDGEEGVDYVDYATDTDDVLKCVINVIEGVYLGISRTVEVEVLILLFPVTTSAVP